jgi:hypothetical protein
MSGGTLSQPASYGEKGVPSPSNYPGGRFAGVSWRDNEGNLWIFSGTTFDDDTYDGIAHSVITLRPIVLGAFNDAWMYDNTTLTTGTTGKMICFLSSGQKVQLMKYSQNYVTLKFYFICGVAPITNFTILFLCSDQ